MFQVDYTYLGVGEVSSITSLSFLSVKGLLYYYLVLKQELYVIEDLLYVEYTLCSKMADSILNSLSIW